MKTYIFKVVMLASVVAVSCSDRNAEKRIAELESRLAKVEGKKSPAVTPVSDPAATASAEKPEGPLPAAKFDNLEYDFGTIKEGEVVEHTFTFKNTGEAPLIIQTAQPSCGCTAPDWSREPIPVGGTGYVKAKFDSNGKPNLQNKTITVTANTWPKQTILRFKAMVLPKADGSQGPVK